VTLTRRHQPLLLQGLSLVIWESSWETSMARSAMEVEARKQREALSDPKDPAVLDLLFFQEKIYATLAACSTGDVPTVEQAYQLPPDVWDAWFEAARAVDPDSFIDERAEPETVTFRDGSSVTVHPAYLPSAMMKVYQLDQEAEQGPADEAVSAVTFRVLYYPKLAGCSTGDVPTLEQARSEWPTVELDRWYAAARRVNPELFLPLEELALANQQKAEQAQKKRPRSRSRS
jgi:hypothetical protein